MRDAGALKGEKRPVRVYDVDQPDPTKKLLKNCDSIAEAERFTGVSRYAIPSYISSKCRCYTNSLGKTITFR